MSSFEVAAVAGLGRMSGPEVIGGYGGDGELKIMSNELRYCQ